MCGAFGRLSTGNAKYLPRLFFFFLYLFFSGSRMNVDPLSEAKKEVKWRFDTDECVVGL